MKKLLAAALAAVVAASAAGAVYADDPAPEEDAAFTEEVLPEEDGAFMEEVLPADGSDAGFGGDFDLGTEGDAELYAPERTDTDEPEQGVIQTPDGITVRLDGEIVVFDAVQPMLIDNRTMVPMRKLFEAMGAEVSWDDETATARGVKGDTTVEITIGSRVLYKNGVPQEIDVPAQLVKNRTLVPVRFISEAFGAEVLWDEELLTVFITTEV